MSQVTQVRTWGSFLIFSILHRCQRLFHWHSRPTNVYNLLSFTCHITKGTLISQSSNFTGKGTSVSFTTCQTFPFLLSVYTKNSGIFSILCLIIPNGFSFPCESYRLPFSVSVSLFLRNIPLYSSWALKTDIQGDEKDWKTFSIVLDSRKFQYFKHQIFVKAHWNIIQMPLWFTLY